ncbi:zinc metalloprotease [Rhodococcus wratislaviensis]|uniref:Uncharacterized protein n=1 Tax=Rhodococcus wratislaviensis NBRC 100605 TaxID=1219028 RepID=X0PXK0_RHOWR|nr:hypothetical protein [Rhodococcus wratislaviensis]GAF48108.1 hypothetical protein RW1_049_00160 [Rhodococcus wratislaviensis NBRC 100605]
MAKNVRLGIIRARHDTTVPVIPDAACIALLMTGEHAVLKYWINTTRGHLDFIDSPMFPWVDITLGADTSRDAQATAAVNALRAKFPDPEPLAGLDGLIVVTHPGAAGFDGGTTGVAGLPVAVLPMMTSDHTFMCHETGHVLGIEHTFGLDNNGTDWDPTDATIIVGPEYGSPYDLMSSASFGGRWLGTGPFYAATPTFVGPIVAGWPNTGAFSMGPHLSRANLHLHMPDALAGRVVERPFPQPGTTVTARIVPTSASAGTCVLILHPPGEPPNGAGRVYVEFRTAKGWDAGMDSIGPSLSREGVVVHSLVDQPNVGVRAWYRGSIPTVSVDADVAVESTPLVVRADSVGPEGNWVDLAVTVGAARAVEIVRGYHSDDMVGVVGVLQRSTSPCGDPIRKGTFATSTTSKFGVRTRGFGGGGEPAVGAAAVAWTVGGVPVAGLNGTVEVPVAGATFAVEYTIDPVVFELGLTSRGGERFETPVVVTVTGDATSATARTTYAALGWFDGIHPEDLEALGTCLRRIADRYRVAPPPFRKPSPDPPWAAPALRRLAEVRWFDRAVRFLGELPSLDAEGSDALRQIVSSQVHPVPTMLDRLGAGGVDFSVPESELTEWLNNPEFTPYPALAEVLLKLLDGNQLRRPVFLDVIVFNYEHTPGNSSPRKVEDVNSDALEVAVVDASNNRYGEVASNFRELLISPV